jgi:NADPH:quinone reductase-like Zn-dependent oxidoreductase
VRAVEIRRTGPPESLECGEIPLREAGEGEIRIRVHRAGVNFADVLARQGIYPDAPKPPFVPGYEVSGVVETAGQGVTGMRAGDRVAAFTRFGGYAEYAVADARFAVPLPPGFDFTTGAAVPVNFATAYHCLFHTGPLHPGDRVLIHAAAGGVGLAAVRMAKGAGAILFGTAGSGEKIDFLRRYGVDHPIDYHSQDFVEEVRKATGGEGVDVILDSIGGRMIGQDLRVLRPGGRIVSLGLTAPPLLRLAAPATGGPRRCGGVDEAACGARKKSRRAEPAASGRTVASVAEGTPPRARNPGSRHSQPRVSLRSLGGGLRSWLAVRRLCTAALRPHCAPTPSACCAF